MFDHTWKQHPPGTRDTYRRVWRKRVEPHLGEAWVVNIGPEVVEHWLATLVVTRRQPAE